MPDSPPRRLAWPLANLLALLATVAVNALANVLPLNGVTTGEVVNRDPVLFQPAGWAFSIWSLIYLLLAGFVVYGLTPRGQADPRLRRVSPAFVLTCVANCAWLVLWHFERLPLSLLVMVGLLATLIRIYGRLPRAGLRIPFGVYLGWISVATIANAAVVLDRAGWDGWGLAPETWTVLLIVAGAALATTIALAFLDPFYPAVFVWAYAGIAARQGDAPDVAAAAVWCAGALAVLTLVTALLAWRRPAGGRPETPAVGVHPAPLAG